MHARIVLAAVALAALSVGALAETAAGNNVTVSQAWARATPAGAKVGAAYMTIMAAPGAADALTAVSTDKAGRSELHNHIMKGDVMEMRRVERIDVPAGGKAELKPSGYHLMLMELKEPLKAGETIKMKLKFEKAGAMEVAVPVIGIGAAPPAGKPAAGGGQHQH